MAWRVLVDWDRDGSFEGPPAGNQVTNGTFTTNDDDWTFGDNITHSVSGGKLAAYHDGSPASDDSFYQSLGFRASVGDTFSVSFKCRNTHASTDIALKVSIRPSAADDSGEVDDTFTIPAAGSETTYTLSGAATAPMTEAHVVFIFQTYGVDGLEFDDIEVLLTHSSADDITEDVIGDLTWFTGCRPFQRMGDEAAVDILLENSDKRYSPEVTSGALYGKLKPNTPVAIRYSRSGNGAHGEYFNDPDSTRHLKGYPDMERTDSTIDFAWGAGSPDASIQTDNFSVRWTGFITPDYSEEYTFYVNVSDGCRLWIGGVLVVDNWTSANSTAAEESGTIKLTANQAYPFVLEYYDRSGSDATCQLKWEASSVTKAVVPNSALTLPDYELWEGVIEDVLPAPLLYGQRTATLRCIGRKEQLQRFRLLMPLDTDARTSALIKDALEEIFGTDVETDGIRDGYATVAYCHDNFMFELGEKPDALFVLQSIIDLEWGKLFWGRGRWEFWPRYYLWNRSATEDLSLDNDMADLDYISGQGDIINQATATVYPRIEETSNTQCYQHDENNEALEFPYGMQRTYTLFPTDGLNSLSPVCLTGVAFDTGEDFTAITLGLHPGGVVSESMTCRGQYVEMGALNYRWERYAYTAFTLFGTILRQAGAITHTEEDSDSVDIYGARPYDVDLLLGDKESQARGLAGQLVARFADPSPRVDSVTMGAEDDGTENVNFLTYGVGNKVRVQDAQTGHDRDYVIVGEQHTVSLRQKRHTVQWFLEPIDDLRKLHVLDDPVYGKLDSGNVLGF